MGIYHIDASSRGEASVTRRLSQLLVEKLVAHQEQSVTYRNVGQAEDLKLLDEHVVGAIFQKEEERTHAQKDALKPSDRVVKEAQENDTWVIGLPIYNFSMPSNFKVWADMLARAKVTFQYTADGPVGLLKGKKVYVVISSGGTAIDSDIDFCTPWLRQFLKFVGITDLNLIRADRYSPEREGEFIEQIESEAKIYAA